jgi:hypothetical protein
MTTLAALQSLIAQGESDTLELKCVFRRIVITRIGPS